MLTSLGPLLRKSGHERTITCPDDLQLSCAPGALSQVITNLVVNASLHAFRPDTRGVIAITASGLPDGGVRLVVSDDGRGIRPEHFPHIFDPFFTTRRSEGSTGLGLHIVHNIVAGMGGQISVASEPGSGASFEVRLPAA